jgi:hypothetical protein
MLFWFDLSDAATLTLRQSGSDYFISAIADKSGNSKTMSQATQAYQPLQYDDGRPHLVAKWDGSNDGMTFTEVSNLRTIVSVMRYANTTGYQQWMGAATHYDFWSSLNATAMYANDANNPQSLRDATHYVDSDTVGINTASLNKPTSWHSIITIATSANLHAFGLEGTYGGSAYFQLYVAEVIGYSGTLTAGEIASLEAYLKTKWNL